MPFRLGCESTGVTVQVRLGQEKSHQEGASKDWDNLMVAASHLLEPLVNSGHHEQADAYLQKIWPSDDQTSLREFRNRYWGAIDKAVLAGEVSE